MDDKIKIFFKIFLIGVFLLVVLFGIKILILNNNTNINNLKIKEKKEPIVKLGKCKFEVEIVRNSEEMRKGLSNKKSICDNCGMFFKFSQKGSYGFWMKDMLFPIDLIWIRNNNVIGFKENFSENSDKIIFPPNKVDRVLEINSGKIKKCRIEIGDKVLLLL